MNSRQRAVFLDRDGTLIEDIGVLDSPRRIRMFPDTVRALLQLQKKYLLFIVTNQPGIAEGFVTAHQVGEVNRHLERILALEGIHIMEWYVCPHSREDQCLCIKPNPTFLLQAARKYDLDICRSFMIGDHPHDVLTGDAAEAFGLYLLRGHGLKHLEDLPQDKLVFHTLEDAANWIIAHPTKEDLRHSIRTGAKAIQRGGVVAFPTETVYGLGADAFNFSAVMRIFEIKKRPLYDPLIVHVSNRHQVDLLSPNMCRKAGDLIDRFWPGPLTLVMPKSLKVPDIVTAGKPTIAIRMPANATALELIRLAETPIAAPSANAFGRISPTTASHVEDQLRDGYDVLIDGGACRVGVESTVLSLVSPDPVILRLGGISKEEIEVIIGPVQIKRFAGADGSAIESPGMMSSHYAPFTPLILVDHPECFSQRSDVGIILFQPTTMQYQGQVEVLSKTGDLREASVNLYRVIRKLDASGLALIIAQRVPPEGLGATINDRLNRASFQPVSGAMPKNEGASGDIK